MASNALPAAAVEHEHAWQLVSVETDCGVEIRERMCMTCSAVLIEG